jgi:hypothetical protein
MTRVESDPGETFTPGGPAAGARRIGAGLARALPYPLLLAAGTLVLNHQSSTEREAWLRYISTDLANLGDHPLSSLVLSAGVSEENLLAWTILGLAGLTALGLRLGAGRALALAFGVHVLATLGSQGLVAYRISTGALPASARVMSDVGPSYLVVAALVAALGYGTRGGRVTGALGFAVLAPSLFDGLWHLEIAAVGHVLSIVLALVLPWPLRRACPWARDAVQAG